MNDRETVWSSVPQADGSAFRLPCPWQGHQVRALLRNPAKLVHTGPDLEVHQGRHHPPHLDDLVRGAGYVITMLGDVELQKHAKVNTAFVQQLVPALARSRAVALPGRQAQHASRPAAPTAAVDDQEHCLAG